MKELEQLNYETVEDFCDEIIDTYYKLLDTDYFTSISIVATFDKARDILDYLITNSFKIDFIDLNYLDDYDDEYVIDIFEEDVSCYKAKEKGKYEIIDSDKTYLVEYCSSAIIPCIDSKDIYDVDIDGDYEIDEDEEDYYCEKDCPKCCVNDICDEVDMKASERFKKDISKNTDNKVKQESQNKDVKKPVERKEPRLAENKPVNLKVNEKYTINGKEVSKDEYDKAYAKVREEIDRFEDKINKIFQKRLTWL